MIKPTTTRSQEGQPPKPNNSCSTQYQTRDDQQTSVVQQQHQRVHQQKRLLMEERENLEQLEQRIGNGSNRDSNNQHSAAAGGVGGMAASPLLATIGGNVLGGQQALPLVPDQDSIPIPSFDAPASIQSFIHVPTAMGSKSGATQPSAVASRFAPPATQPHQQTVMTRGGAEQPPQQKQQPQQTANWRFEANPKQQVPLLELQRQHYKLNQKMAWNETRQQRHSTQASASGTQQQTHVPLVPDRVVAVSEDSSDDLVAGRHDRASSGGLIVDTTGRAAGAGQRQMPPQQDDAFYELPPEDLSPPTATTAVSTSQCYSRATTPQSMRRPQQQQIPPSQPGHNSEMADFTDEKQTVDLCSDNEGQGGYDTIDIITNRGGPPGPPPDMDGAAILMNRDSGGSMVDQSFDCLDRSEALRKDLEIARQFFGAGALQSGLISNPRVDEIREPGSVKQEAGRPYPYDDFEDQGVAINDDDDIEIEIGEGVTQTASGHLLVQNQTGPVLSEQEQRAIAKRTRQEMKRRIEERNVVEYGGKCEDDKFVDFSHWPAEFTNLQSALDAYNKLGLPHRIMFRISDHIRDIGGLSTRFKLVCFHNKTLTGAKKDIHNSTVTAIQFKKLRQGTCPVSMTFKFKPDKPHSKRGKFVRSNHVICQHNHPLTVDERRVLQRVEIQDEIQMYLESGLTMPMIVNCINRKFGLSLPYGAFGSVVQKVRHSIHSYIDFTQTQTMQLLQMLERMRQEDPMTRFAYLFDSHLKQRDDVDPTNPQIEALLIQTPLMARNYQAYHDVVFLDSTYNTNQLGLALAIMSGISSEGKNIFLGFAFMARETTENYKWVLENFVKMNNNLSPRTILTDYDSAMATAIEMTFSTKTTHWLCQWHMMQNFKKHFVYLSKRKGASSKLLFNHIIDCIFTESPKKFMELTDVIFSTDQLDEKKLGYLRKMFLIKEKWATSHQPPIFNAGQHTTSRVEAMNSMVKKAMQSRYTLVNLFQEILKLEQRVIRASREVLNSADEHLVVNNPLMASIREKYSKWAFERMLYQHMLSHSLIVIPVTDDHVPTTEIFRLKNDRTVFRVRDTETNDKTTVILIQNSIVDPETGTTFDNIRCNCRYYLSHEFFCAHIFSVLNLLQIRNAEKFHMIGRRWQKDHQENVLPGLYSMNDKTQNPDQYASQFKLYTNNGNVNQNYVFGRDSKHSGMPNDDFGDGQQQSYQQMFNSMPNSGASIDFVNNGQRQQNMGEGEEHHMQQEGGQDSCGNEHQYAPPAVSRKKSSSSTHHPFATPSQSFNSLNHSLSLLKRDKLASRYSSSKLTALAQALNRHQPANKTDGTNRVPRRSHGRQAPQQVEKEKKKSTKPMKASKLLKKMKQRSKVRDDSIICGSDRSADDSDVDMLQKEAKKQSRRHAKMNKQLSSSDSRSSSDSSESGSDSDSSAGRNNGADRKKMRSSVPSGRSISSVSSSSSSSAGVLSMSSISSMSDVDEGAQINANEDGNLSDLSAEFPTMKKVQKHNEFIQSKPKRNFTIAPLVPKSKKANAATKKAKLSQDDAEPPLATNKPKRRKRNPQASKEANTPKQKNITGTKRGRKPKKAAEPPQASGKKQRRSSAIRCLSQESQSLSKLGRNSMIDIESSEDDNQARNASKDNTCIIVT